MCILKRSYIQKPILCLLLLTNGFSKWPDFRISSLVLHVFFFPLIVNFPFWSALSAVIILLCSLKYEIHPLALAILQQVIGGFFFHPNFPYMWVGLSIYNFMNLRTYEARTLLRGHVSMYDTHPTVLDTDTYWSLYYIHFLKKFKSMCPWLICLVSCRIRVVLACPSCIVSLEGPGLQ